MEKGIIVAEGWDASLGKEFVKRELQISSLCPLVLVEEEHHVARHHKDEMRAALLGKEEDVSDGLVDDGRRNLVPLTVEREHKAPLSCEVFLVRRGAVGFALVLLFEESGGFLFVHSDEMLHLHDEHLRLAALTQDVTHGYDLDGFCVVLHHEVLLVGMVSVIAQDAKQLSVEVMGALDGILGTRVQVDNEVLIVVILLLQGYERCVELLQIVFRHAGALLYLVKEVISEIARGEVVTHVLYETVFYIVCHKSLSIKSCRTQRVASCKALPCRASTCPGRTGSIRR